MKISCFLPVRAGSERVKNKNTKRFSTIGESLLSIKLTQLISCPLFTEVILSTDDAIAINIAESIKHEQKEKLVIIQRPEYLAKSNTNLSDLIRHAGKVCSYDHIMWTHTTSPFIDSLKYEEIINYFCSIADKYDSLITASTIRSFIWDTKSNDIINRGNNTQQWPRTQDLMALYEIDNGAFIASKDQYINGERVGKNPCIYELDKISKIDIDDETDFNLAELIYNSKLSKAHQNK